MLGQTQTKNHQFDVCGRIYYHDVCYDGTDGELVAETILATSHDEAEQIFKQNLLEHARKFDMTVDEIRIGFSLDITMAESASTSNPYDCMRSY